MLGAAFALLSALSFSLNSVLVRRGVVEASASQAQFVTVTMGVPMFLGAAVVTGQLFRAGEILGSGYLLLAVAGILHFGLGRYCNYRTIAALGAARAAPLFTIAIPYSVLVAVVFLDESITVGMAFGIALILVGPAINVQRRHSPVRVAGGSHEAPTVTMRLAEGYLFGVLGALSQGTSPILIRSALQDGGPGVLAGLVAYVAAAIVLTAAMAMPARRELIRSMNVATVRLFFGAGTFVFLAQMFRFVALSIAPVTIVAPLTRSGGIFTLALSYAINRRLEAIGLRVVAGILISVAGAVLLIATRPG